MLFTNYKELYRESHAPIQLLKGDTLTYTYRETVGHTKWLRRPILAQPVELASYTLTDAESMVITEAVVFSAEVDGRRVLGSLSLEAARP